jgi:aminomethyltransferase
MEKRTLLHQEHIKKNARMVNFSGWILPLEYESILKETKAVRAFCGLFDVSHMGKIVVKGKGAKEFLQRLTVNDLDLIKEGQLQYNLFLNPEGGIIDDFILYNLKDDYLCIVNASNTEKVYSWFNRNREDNIEIIDKTKDLALFSLQGPNSELVMERILSKKINIKYMEFAEEEINNIKLLFSRSGYTGEDGFEICVENKDAIFFWKLIIEEGLKHNLKLCGLGARDILRIEAGYPLYGQEIDENINPYEAALDWVVKLNKDFIGKEAIVKKKNVGINIRRVGFILKERAVARTGYQIYFDGEQIGKVSSGTYSPNLDNFIGMAYLKIDFTKVSTPIKIKIRDKLYCAEIAKFPFIKTKTKK